MSDGKNVLNETENQQGDVSFADMLAAHDTSNPVIRFRTGEKVSVKIVAMGDDVIFLATGSKVDGVVDRKELENAEGELTYSVGDELELYVLSVNSNEIRLSKALSGIGGITVLEEAEAAGVPVEGKVIGPCKGGFQVEVLKHRAFCPTSQIDFRADENPDVYTGKILTFLIIKLENKGRNLVVSHRAVLEKERAESIGKVLGTLNSGNTIDVKISRLASFGAFAEIAPGFEGMIHLSELSWSRVQQADEAVTLGDMVRVKILSIEEDAKKNIRVSLSLKQASGNPWEHVAEKLTVGEILPAKVISLKPFGAFVAVLPGIEGLVHISEMSWTKRVNKPEDIVAVGDTVSVKIKDIDVAAQRISLSMKDAEGDPWGTVAETFTAGSSVTGIVEKKAQFGVFITLSAGVTGLLPNALINLSPSAKTFAGVKEGDSLELVVQDVDQANRRITLAPADIQMPEKNDDWREYAQVKEKKVSPKKSGIRKEKEPASVSVGSSEGFGSFGQALQQAMDAKKK